MVVMSPDLPSDTLSIGSGVSSTVNPPAVRCVLSEEELLKHTYRIFQGSGGAPTVDLNLSPSGASANSGRHLSKVRSSFVDILEDVESAFGLSKKELTQALQVKSRKTLYNWIKNESVPRGSAINRLFSLMSVAKAWNYYGLPKGKEVINLPVFKGKSVMDLLSEDDLDESLILFAGSRLRMRSGEKGKLKDPFA